MGSEDEVKINARGLSNPGPRLMVETALEKEQYGIIRVIVSNWMQPLIWKHFSVLNKQKWKSVRSGTNTTSLQIILL